MPIKFRCPSCRQAYTIASKKAGTKLFCQKCKTKIKVPEKSTPEPPVEPVQKPTQPPAIGGKGEVPNEDLFADVTPDRNAVEDVEFSESPEPDTSSTNRPPKSEADFRTAEIEVGGESNERLSPDQYDPPPLDQMDGLGSSESTGGDASEAPSDDDDDLAAVLAFEKSMEDGGETTAPAHVPLPDELFAEDDDEEEDGFGSRADDDAEELDLTPMVDVTVLLLIFFMITASFSIQKTLSVPPPDPEKEGASTSTTIKEEEEQEQTTIHIDSRNVISVDDEPIPNPSRLVDILRSKRTTDVLITSHESAIHEMLVKVVDAAQEVGMQKIRIGVTKGPE